MHPARIWHWLPATALGGISLSPSLRFGVIRLALLIPMIGALLLVHPELIHACKCATPGPPTEEMGRSDLVFSGRVVSIQSEDETDGATAGADAEAPDLGVYSIEFDVETVWKGTVHETTYLTTNRDSASCGFTFAEGVSYVVYAQDDLIVHRCSRTRPLSEAAQDLGELGEGRAPTEGAAGAAAGPSQSGPSGSPGGGGCGLSPGEADLSGVALMFGIVCLGLRRKRPGRS